jgi:TonB-dependent starch-binding outer membrane protein SusC
MKIKWYNYFKIKCLFILIICTASINIIHAQNRTVKGTVTSEDGPLYGVRLLIKGTTNTTFTDFDGSFNANVKDTDVLVVSYIGYRTKEVSIGSNTKLDIKLGKETANLEEVIVIGYGTAKRKDLTGSIVSLKAEQFDNVKANSFEGSLQSRAAGVQVISNQGGPDAGFTVRVRGGTSINASSDPLYVIDGFAISGGGPTTNNATGLGNSTTSPLSTLDPSTIESIEVLKDASATAIYGSRGANGVIMITTKKGKKGKTAFNFETFTNVSAVSKKIDMLSPQEFVDWRLEFTPWNPNGTDPLIGEFRDQFGNDISLNDPNVKKYNWQDNIFRTAFTTNYKLSMAGGAENNSYSATFSYADQEGIVKTSNSQKYNLNLNIDQNVGKRFKTGAMINMGFIKSSGIVSASAEDANGRSGVISNTLSFSPVQGLTRFPDAEYDAEGNLVSFRNGDFANPNRILKDNINRGKIFQTFGNMYLEYKISDHLKFKSTVGANLFLNKGEAYFTEQFGWSRTFGGVAFTRTGMAIGLRTEQNLNYAQRFGKDKEHSINVTSVYEQQQSSWESTANSASGFKIPGVNLGNLGTALVTNPVSNIINRDQLQSFLTRIQYDYSDRYTLNLSGRYDGASKFSEKARWGFFPSAGIAWKISNEKFLKNNKVVNDFKLRASYGVTGNAQIDPYQSLSNAGLASYVFNGNQISTGATIYRLENNALTWETTTQSDIGLVLGLFGNKIWFEADYYDKRTKNLLLNVPLPATSGYKTVFKNLGLLSNKGYEFSLNTKFIDNEKFSWKSSFNISFNKNKVLNLGDAKQIFVESIGSNQIGDDYVIKVGEPLGLIYGLKTDGVYNYGDFTEFDGLTEQQSAEKIRTDAANAGIGYFDVFYTLKTGVVKANTTKHRPGMQKFADQNGDGVVNTDDRTIIGRTAPKHFGGLTNNFTYKNLDLSILTSWSYGNEIYNKTKRLLSGQAIPYPNKVGNVRDRWTPENPNTIIPGVFGESDSQLEGNAISSSVEDGSYLRISNITLGYNFPKKFVKRNNLTTFRLYTSLDNVYVFTKYSGYDPDVSVGSNQLTPGLDFDAYPKARTFRFGVNVGF